MIYECTWEAGPHGLRGPKLRSHSDTKIIWKPVRVGPVGNAPDAYFGQFDMTGSCWCRCQVDYTLADEFDKEVQRKYGNDLDTSLIFAGLFSAVSSAFIIQIQPELQPDPKIQALLGLLVQNITAAPVSLPTRPTTIAIIAQSLLYFSLFSALLAALLAVLGKQWLLHYDSMFPLLLQFIAVTVRRRIGHLPMDHTPSHHRIVLGLTTLGSTLTHSPFDTPPPPSKEVNAVIWIGNIHRSPYGTECRGDGPRIALVARELRCSAFPEAPGRCFESCFNGRDVHEGMGDRATIYVKAIGVLEMVIDTPQRTFDLWTFEPTVLRNISRPLRSEEVTLDRERVHDIRNQRALRFTAAQDLPEQHLKAILRSFKVHDSSLGEFLLADFLFSKRFERPWDVQIADDILTKLAQFMQTARLHNYIGEDNRCRNAAYCLCATSRPPITTMISVLEVVRVEDWDSLDIRSGTQDVEWVYATLERLHDVRHHRVHLISELLLVLFICRPIRGKPKHWFSDDELGPILEEASVWPSFTRNGTAYYSILGEKLSNIPRVFYSRLVYHVQNPSQEFKATIMVRLGDAVARAGERAKPDIRFALTINGELANLQQLEQAGTDEYEHWNGLRDTWLTEVDLLKGALENRSPGTAEDGLKEDGIEPAILRLK
ncbi:hypothetical protein B0H13DRAFT_1915968 [Mycena leptocephala]|nr:hypothetical protein B0H13DRAFT_1915968 [Mycena leptocephala]